MKINYSQYICILFFIKSFLLNTYSIQATENNTSIDNNHTITVYVHGTFPMRKFLQYTPFRLITYCPQGLSLVGAMSPRYHFYKMVKKIIELEPSLYSWDKFYIFGWKSEKVYDYIRVNAAQDLISQLRLVIQDYYDKHNVIPSLKLIGFSHGGNVVLHTAQFLPIRIAHQNVLVQAWLFGTPVQQINKHFVNSPYFSQVFSFYSLKDWMQRMDPQGIWYKSVDKKLFWSDRMFDDNDKCIQINFTVNDKSISHSYYRSILGYFPLIEKQTINLLKQTDSHMISVNLQI